MPSPATTRPRRAAAAHRPVVVGDRTVLVVTPHAAPDGPGTVRTGLVMPVIGRIVDVTVHPSAARATLLDAAGQACVPPTQAEAALRDQLAAAARQVDAWSGAGDLDLLAALGGAGFPVLGACYANGAEPLAEVPRWAVPLVSGATVRAGARALLGPKATRPVVAALARRLADEPTAAGALVRVGLVLVGSTALEPDRLARLLGAAGPTRTALELPANELVALGRSIAPRWGPTRTERILLDAIELPHGPRLLADGLRFARDLGIHGPQRVPNRLVALHDAYRTRIATDAHPPRPRPDPVPVPAARRQVTPHPAPVAAAPAGNDPRHRIYRPPAGPAPPIEAATPLRAPAAVAALDGATAGPLRLVLPRTCGDLTRWSRLLGNCLGDYGPAVAAGRSTIVGVERDGTLRYALELTPDRVIRQFTGHANRPAEPRDRDAVVGLLGAAGALETTDPRNRVWLPDGPLREPRG